MSRQLERLLSIDELIRKPARQTALTLAEALEMSERTIRNDLDFLRDRYEAPLNYNRKLGYHYTDPEWRLPSIPLSQGELFALTLGARMLSAYSGSAYRKQLRSAIDQLAKRLPEQAWVDLQQLSSDAVMFRMGAELDLNPEIWQTLEQACQYKQRVWVRYAGPGKPISEREVDPYILHFSRNNPYMTGWCHQRQEPRWFRVDRIQAIKLLDERFEIDPTFDREAHFASAFQHEVGGVPQAMVIWFDPPTAPYIRERRWHPTQQIEEHPDGSLTLRFVVRGLSEVKRWVLFYGKGAKVLGPPQLVTMVRDEIEGMQAQYQQEEGQ
ncbi:MAG: WYL domain-containing transcriptional regulator [Cyanobacteria bacterium P01_F01_bin.153]